MNDAPGLLPELLRRHGALRGEQAPLVARHHRVRTEKQHLVCLHEMELVST